MAREDLGKMLGNHFGYPQLSLRPVPPVDAVLQRGAEAFWNDVIDALCADIDARKESLWFMAFDPEADGIETYFADFLCGHLRRMKIGDDE